MQPAPTSKETYLGAIPEDFNISSYQASGHHTQAASSTPYLHPIDEPTSMWDRTFQTPASSSFGGSPTWNTHDSLWGCFSPPVLLHLAHPLLAPSPGSSAWQRGAISPQHCHGRRIDAGLTLWKTRRRQWAKGLSTRRGPETPRVIYFRPYHVNHQ